MRLMLLVSPLSKGAFFADRIDVARAELHAHFPECEATLERTPTLEFLNVRLDEAALPELSRLSFVQGIFERTSDGLTPLDQDPGFCLPEDLVFGAKYAGKTNELVTQLAINLALRVADVGSRATPKLLDPMAGRGTTLLWAVRYGIDARGIERDRSALDGLQRHVKKQTKLHRIKHRQSQGFVGRRDRKDRGRFLQYELAGHSLKLVIGDSRDVEELLAGERFSLLVSDLPYGIQHLSREGRRNPLENLARCAESWASCLRKGGAMVVSFNALQPKRSELTSLFVARGLQLQDFSAPHRMSESILRDVVVFKKV